MRTLLAILLTLPLFAQEPAAPAAPAVTTTSTEPASPVPSSTPEVTGWIELGYRWRTDVGGSLDAYRSIINLGSGPKIIGADFTLTNPKYRWYDQIQVRSNGWGDEPSSSVHVEAKKTNIYDFNADYRDFAYFNFLPSYADPLLSRGIVLNEQSFDTRRKIAALSLDIRPGHWWTPYFGWDHDSSAGTGAAVFVTNGNEYPVPNQLRDFTDLYRGGVRFEKPHFHVTLEEGGTAFKSDQSLFQNPGSTNYGNVSSPVLGHTLDLTSLLSAYGIGGASAYTKALLTASPATWLDIYGQFLFSQPDSHVNYEQSDTGSLYLQSQLLFYSSEQQLTAAKAKQPHTTASLGAEIRPLNRVRIVESWMTDRLHAAGSATSTQTLLNPPASLELSSLLATSLASDYSQESVDVYFDVTHKLSLRGGYRYVWGDANYAFLPPAGLASSDREQLRRNVGVGAVTFRPGQKISVTGEFEGASSSGVYFRTSLYNYQKVRAQAHYQPFQSLSISADFTLLNNQNPLPGLKYDYSSHQESVSLYWVPRGGKIFDIQGSYSRSALRSNISFLDPGTLASDLSAYRDYAHTATALFDLKWPGEKRFGPRLSAGGSLFISSGSRPTSYYQPVAKLWVPFGKHLSWFTEWRYYGYGEAFYLYEGFRTHLVTTGLRITR
jgi:hypothetical protein